MKRQRDAPEMFTVASRQFLLLEATASASERAAHTATGGRVITTADSAAARECSDHRKAIVDRRISAATTVRARIALIAVYSATPNHDGKDSAEDAADVASATATGAVTATSG